jgi:hypothetical protein
VATDISELIDVVRQNLNELEEDLVNGFWTDDELAGHIDKGARDLWRAINDNYQNYFITVDESNVSLAASSSTLTGVPTDVSIVRGIEVRSLNDRPGVVFEHRDYMHPDFQRARSLSTQDPSYGTKIFYDLHGAGAPIAAPTVRVAPQINAALNLRLVYVPTLARITADDSNPIPGESDNALIAWATAHAMAKQAEDQKPDAGWLAIYGTEKKNLLTSLTPRQTEDEETSEAFFEDLWQ